MPHTFTMEKTVYSFDELSDQAKEKAREWFREGRLDYDWWDSVYEDANQIARILGIDLCTKTVKLMGGGTRQEPNIMFSGFWSQGDGACFEGNYSYAKGAAKKIRQYAPQDVYLHKIADGLQDVQRRNFYKLSATVRHRGHYVHEMCTEIDVYDNPSEANAEMVIELLRDFMRWIYKTLEKECDYLTSDESTDENIRCNAYEFCEDGSRA